MQVGVSGAQTFRKKCQHFGPKQSFNPNEYTLAAYSQALEPRLAKKPISYICWVGTLMSSLGYSGFLPLVMLVAWSSCYAPKASAPHLLFPGFQTSWFFPLVIGFTPSTWPWQLVQALSCNAYWLLTSPSPRTACGNVVRQVCLFNQNLSSFEKTMPHFISWINVCLSAGKHHHRWSRSWFSIDDPLFFHRDDLIGSGSGWEKSQYQEKNGQTWS